MNKPFIIALNLAVFILLTTAVIPVAGQEQTGTINVEIVGLRNDSGHVLLALYNSAQGFPENRSKVFASASATIDHGLAFIKFNNVPYGIYAISVLHDENNNGDMDYGFMSIPTEGYGYSQNVRTGMTPPSFADCSFTLDSASKNITIRMIYF